MADYVANEELQKEEESSVFSLANLWTIVVLNWQWILLSTFIALSLAFLYLRYTSPVYNSAMKVLIKDEEGRVVELKCTYDPTTHPTTGEWRSVKGTIHWVSIPHAKEIELRNYDRLFTLADMSQVPEDKDYKDFLNPDSLIVGDGWAEPALLDDASGIAVQFERTGYYVKDKDSTPEKAVFNKTTALKDSYKPE